MLRLLTFLLPLTYGADPSTEDMVAKISAEFLGRPYMLNPTGDAGDAQGELREDVFDCLTFVETVLTKLSCPQNAGPACEENSLKKFRYKDAKADFAHRKHFPEEWMATNTTSGALTDITADIAGNSLAVVKATLHPRKWMESQRPNEKFPQIAARMKVEIPYLPLSSLFKDDKLDPAFANRIPNGVVFNTVREHYYIRDGKNEVLSPLVITHTGFVFRKAGQLFVRHAWKSGGKIVDYPFENYFRQYLHVKTTVRGINFRRVNSP